MAIISGYKHKNGAEFSRRTPILTPDNPREQRIQRIKDRVIKISNPTKPRRRCSINRARIITAIEKQRKEANNIRALETELQQFERQLKTLDREQKQLLQWALKGFPEETVIAENKRINENRISLKSQKENLEMQIKTSREAAVSLPKLEAYIQLISSKLTNLDFDMKRLALDMLNIKVWIDGLSVEIAGTIPIEDADVVTTSS